MDKDKPYRDAILLVITLLVILACIVPAVACPVCILIGLAILALVL